jgi:hypothetical protein
MIVPLQGSSLTYAAMSRIGARITSAAAWFWGPHDGQPSDNAVLARYDAGMCGRVFSGRA